MVFLSHLIDEAIEAKAIEQVAQDGTARQQWSLLHCAMLLLVWQKIIEWTSENLPF